MIDFVGTDVDVDVMLTLCRFADKGFHMHVDAAKVFGLMSKFDISYLMQMMMS